MEIKGRLINHDDFIERTVVLNHHGLMKNIRPEDIQEITHRVEYVDMLPENDPFNRVSGTSIVTEITFKDAEACKRFLENGIIPLQSNFERECSE